MTQHLYLATQNGLFITRQEGETWVKMRRGLNGYNVTSVIAYDGYILAGTTDGIFRSADGGQTWIETNNGLSIRYVRWLAIHPEASEFVLAGTEPAGIFVSRDRADSWLESPEIYQFRDKHGWFLPYSPEAGCVRGFAIANTSKDQSRVYAAVEVGGVLVSYDKGVTWQLVEGSDGNPDMDRSLGTLIHPDVHSISVHPSSSDLVTAPTGGGLYRSVDGGKTWICLYRAYCRAVWVNPDNPQHIIFGPADGVSRNGRIEESNDGGRTWHSASTGITVPWTQHMVERFFQADNVLLAVLSNGELLSTGLDKIEWHRILPEVKQIRSVASNN